MEWIYSCKSNFNIWKTILIFQKKYLIINYEYFQMKKGNKWSELIVLTNLFLSFEKKWKSSLVSSQLIWIEKQMFSKIFYQNEFWFLSVKIQWFSIDYSFQQSMEYFKRDSEENEIRCFSNWIKYLFLDRKVWFDHQLDRKISAAWFVTIEKG